MKTTLALIENITENIKNENWSAVADDIGLISRPEGYLLQIKRRLEESEGEYYPDSEESERWIKSIGPMLPGEYACGNI